MEEDEILYDDNQKEKGLKIPMASDSKFPSADGASDSKNDLEETKDRSPSNRTYQSPSKKKKGSSNPTAAGVSLRKRNMLKGQASPKIKEVKGGLPLGSNSSKAQLENTHGEGKDETLSKNKNEAAKVGSKPPKIPK
ncbi:hypothetical protein Bca101_067617 [Brassica carinata]